ncbi:glycosyltransferase family 2 protein [Pararhodobacter oceanensis]|uniref:glycosyltransferase family 2 protein n=1 Tax=Pararhodobacter oceanensis TaxID=2172121 RepID=UPI003A931FFD
MNDPRISVVIPVYNGLESLPVALASIDRQRYPNMQTILVNDGSTDGSGAFIDALPNVVAIHQENRGIPAARNAGLMVADGDFVTLLDQDDYWHDGKLRLQLDAFARQPDLEFVLGSWVHELKSGASAPAWATEKYFDGAKPGWVFGTMMARRELFDRIGYLDESRIWGGDDVDWFARAVNHGVANDVLPDVVLTRIVHDTNHSRKTRQANAELLQVIRQKVKVQRTDEG